MSATKCDECDHWIPDDAPSLINNNHADTCSCYPHDECGNCGRTLDSEGECRGGCSQRASGDPVIPSVLADAITDQVEWIEPALVAGVSVAGFVSAGCDFDLFEDIGTSESVSHAVGFLRGVSAALGLSESKLLALASRQRPELVGLLTRTARQ